MSMPTKHTVAQMKYDLTHRRTYGFRLHNELDKDIINKLSSVPSMQGYIKKLIRSDISGRVSVPIPDASMSILQEEAEKSGKSVPEIIKLIVNDWAIRNGK